MRDPSRLCDMPALPPRCHARRSRKDYKHDSRWCCRNVSSVEQPQVYKVCIGGKPSGSEIPPESTERDPTKKRQIMSDKRRPMGKTFFIWRVCIRLALARSGVWTITSDKSGENHMLACAAIVRFRKISFLRFSILPLSVEIGFVPFADTMKNHE